MMDFHSLKRKALLALCKKHGIPGTGTNLDLAHQLSSLLNPNPNPNKKPEVKSKPSKDQKGSKTQTSQSNKGSEEEEEDLKKSQVVSRATRSRKVEDVPMPPSSPLHNKKPKMVPDADEDTKRGSRIRAEIGATVDKENAVAVPSTRSLRTREISSHPINDVSPRKTRRGVINNVNEPHKVDSLKMNAKKTRSGKQQDDGEGALNKTNDVIHNEVTKHQPKPQGRATRRTRTNDSVQTDAQQPPKQVVAPPSSKNSVEEMGVAQTSKVSNVTTTRITRTTRSTEVPILPSPQDLPQGVRTRNKKVEEMIVTQESKTNNNEITTRATRSSRVTEMPILPSSQDQLPGTLNKNNHKVKEMGATRDTHEITTRATRSTRVTEVVLPTSQDPPPGFNQSSQKVDGVGHAQDSKANNETVRTRSKRGREVAVLSSSPVAKKKSKTTQGMTTVHNDGVKKEVSTRSRRGTEVIIPAPVPLEKKITRRSTTETDDQVKKPSPVVNKSDTVRTSATKANVSQKARSDAGRTLATKANVSQKTRSLKNKKDTRDSNNIKESTGPRRTRKENEDLKKEHKAGVAVLNKSMQIKSRKRANEQDDKQGTSPDQEPLRKPSKRLKRDTTTVDDSGALDGKKEPLSKEKVVAPEKEIVTAGAPDKTKSQVKKSSSKGKRGKIVSNEAEPEIVTTGAPEKTKSQVKKSSSKGKRGKIVSNEAELEVDTQEEVVMPTLEFTDSSNQTVVSPAIVTDKMAPGVETESVEIYKNLVQVPDHVTDKMESVLETETVEGDTNLDLQAAKPGEETESVEGSRNLVQVPEHVTDNKESVLVTETVERDENLGLQAPATTENVTDSTVSKAQGAVEDSLVNIEKESSDIREEPQYVEGDELNIKFASQVVEETGTSVNGSAVKKDNISTCIEGNSVRDDSVRIQVEEDHAELIDSVGPAALGTLETADDTVQTIIGRDMQEKEVLLAEENPEGVPVGTNQESSCKVDTRVLEVPETVKDELVPVVEGNAVVAELKLGKGDVKFGLHLDSTSKNANPLADVTVQQVQGAIYDPLASSVNESSHMGKGSSFSSEKNSHTGLTSRNEEVNASVMKLTDSSSGAEGIIATGPDHDFFNDEGQVDDAEIQKEVNKGVDTTAAANFNVAEEGNCTISDLKARAEETLPVTCGISSTNVSETSVDWNAKGADEPVKLQEHACEEPERVPSGDYTLTLEDETMNQEGELVRTTDSPESEGHNLGNSEYEDPEPTVEGEASCKLVEEKAISGMTSESKNDKAVVEDLNEKTTHISQAFDASAVDVEEDVAAGEENYGADGNIGKIEDESNTPSSSLEGEASSILSENQECVVKGHDLVEEKFGHVSGNKEGVVEGQDVESLQPVSEELVSLKKDALSETRANVNAISDELLTTDQVLEEPFDDKVAKNMPEDKAGTPNLIHLENNKGVIMEQDVELFQQVSEDLEEPKDGVSVAHDTVNTVSVEVVRTDLTVEKAHDCMYVKNVVGVASAGVSSVSPTSSSPNNIEDKIAVGERDFAVESETSNFEEKGNPEWMQHLEEPKDLKKDVVTEPHADSTSLSNERVSVNNEAMVTGTLGLPVLQGQGSDDVGYEDDVPKRKEERSCPRIEAIAIVETDYSNDDGDLGGTVLKELTVGASPISQALRSSAEVVEKDAVELEDNYEANTSKAGDEEKSDHAAVSNEGAVAQDTKHSQIDPEELHNTRNDAVPYQGGGYDAIPDELNKTDDVLERSFDCMVGKDVVQDINVGASPLSQVAVCSPINIEDIKEVAASGTNVGFKNDIFTVEGENPQCAQQVPVEHVDQKIDAVSEKHDHSEFVSEPSMENNSIQETLVQMNSDDVGVIIVEEENAGNPVTSHSPKDVERDVDILEKGTEIESSKQVPESFNELKDSSCEMPSLSNVEFDQHACEQLERSELRVVYSDWVVGKTLAEDDRNYDASPSNAEGNEAVIAKDNPEPEKHDTYLQEEEEGVIAKEESPQLDDFVHEEAESSQRVREEIIELGEDADAFQDVPNEFTRRDGLGHPGAVSNEPFLGFAEFMKGGAGCSVDKGGDIVSEKGKNTAYGQDIAEDDKNATTSGVDYDFEINANSVDGRIDYENLTGISDQHTCLPDSDLDIPGNGDAVSDKQFFEAIETVSIPGDVDAVSDKQSFEANETGISGGYDAVSDKHFFETNEIQKSSMAVVSNFSTGREVEKDVLDGGVTLHQDASFDSWNIVVDETNNGGSYISNEKMTQTVYHSEMRVVETSREKQIQTEYHQEVYQDFSPIRPSTTNDTDVNEELSAGIPGLGGLTENEDERGPNSSNRDTQGMAYDHRSHGEVNVERDEVMNGDGEFAMDAEDGDFSNMFDEFSVSSQQTNEMEENCDRDRDDE